MEPKQNYLAVGLFVLATMIGAVIFAIWMADLKDNAHTNRYQMFVGDSVNGLSVGSPVKYRGVDIGKVATINIPRHDPNTVRIVMDINDETPITVGTTAVMQLQGITGLAYIELKGAQAGAPPIPLEGDETMPIIPSARSEFRQIVDTVPDMLQKFTELAEKLGGFASEENKQRFDTILSNLEGFSNDVGGENGNGKTLIEEMRQTSVAVRDSANNIKDVAQKTRGDTQRILEKSLVTIDKINNVADTTQDLSKQGYQDLHDLMLEIKKTARDLQNLSREIKDNPSKVIIPTQKAGVTVPKE